MCVRPTAHTSQTCPCLRGSRLFASEPTEPQACREVVQETCKPASAHCLGGACPPPPQDHRGGVIILYHPRIGWGVVTFLGAHNKTLPVMSAEASLLKGHSQLSLLNSHGSCTGDNACFSQASVVSRSETEPQLVHLRGTLGRRLEQQRPGGRVVPSFSEATSLGPAFAPPFGNWL